jgi:hypothetical protein
MADTDTDRVLRIRSLAKFVPEDTEVDEVLRDLWASGESRPEW